MHMSRITIDYPVLRLTEICRNDIHDMCTKFGWIRQIDYRTYVDAICVCDCH